MIIYYKNIREHIHHVDKILSTLGAARVTLNVKKCHFFERKVEYLGHMVTPGQVSMDDSNVESLKKAQRSKTKTQLTPFVGLCKFIGGSYRTSQGRRIPSIET